ASADANILSASDIAVFIGPSVAVVLPEYKGPMSVPSSRLWHASGISIPSDKTQENGMSADHSPPQVVVITGASAGLGRAIAQRFADRGAAIGLIARGHERLDSAKRDVESRGGTA